MSDLKPGVFAVVLGNSKYAGMIVELIKPAPERDFLLPDGEWHHGCDGDGWVLRFQKKVTAPFGQTTRKTYYGVGSASKLQAVYLGADAEKAFRKKS